MTHGCFANLIGPGANEAKIQILIDRAIVCEPAYLLARCGMRFKRTVGVYERPNESLSHFFWLVNYK